MYLTWNTEGLFRLKRKHDSHYRITLVLLKALQKKNLQADDIWCNTWGHVIDEGHLLTTLDEKSFLYWSEM